MTRHADIRAIITIKDIIQHFLAPYILVLAHFCQEWFPELVCLGESFFDRVAGEGGLDVGFCGAAVACYGGLVPGLLGVKLRFGIGGRIGN